MQSQGSISLAIFYAFCTLAPQIIAILSEGKDRSLISIDIPQYCLYLSLQALLSELEHILSHRRHSLLRLVSYMKLPCSRLISICPCLTRVIRNDKIVLICNLLSSRWLPHSFFISSVLLPTWSCYTCS